MHFTSFDLDNQFQKDLKGTVFPQVGATILKTYTDKLEQRCQGDYRIQWRGRKIDIDIKAEQDMPANFPVEVLQDWQSNDIGWLYTLDAEVWYGRYQKTTLQEVYRISLPKIKAIPREVSKTFASRNVAKGYGNTVIQLAPLDVLQREKAAHLLWSNDAIN